ncbi:MAG: hypothetical protein AAF349_23305 [Cyanobacteria bacterium P01_A01_bin.68]
MCLKLWVDSTQFDLKWNKRRIRSSKLEGACGAGNNGILTKATAGFEPADGGFADLDKPRRYNGFTFHPIFLPQFYPNSYFSGDIVRTAHQYAVLFCQAK